MRLVTFDLFQASANLWITFISQINIRCHLVAGKGNSMVFLILCWHWFFHISAEESWLGNGGAAMATWPCNTVSQTGQSISGLRLPLTSPQLPHLSQPCPFFSKAHIPGEHSFNPRQKSLPVSCMHQLKRLVPNSLLRTAFGDCVFEKPQSQSLGLSKCYQHCLGTWDKCKFSGHTPDLLNQ